MNYWIIDACGQRITFSLLLMARREFEEEGENGAIINWSGVEVKSHPFQYFLFQESAALVKESDFQSEPYLVNVFKDFISRIRWIADSTMKPDEIEIRLKGRSEVSTIKNLYVQS